MSNSITISGLNELTYVTEDDFLAFVDSGSMTTFRVSVATLKDFFAASGSVLSASFASQSISASYTVNADTASYLYPRLYMMTSSWATNVDPLTVVGTASLAYNARTSSHLEGIGSSYENTFIINTYLAPTGSGYIAIPKRVRMYSVAGDLTSVKSGSLFLNKDYIPGTNGYGKAYFFDDNKNQGKFVFEVGDSYTPVNTIGPNIDAISSGSKGFLFQSNEAGNTNLLGRTGSLLFISGSGRTYGRIFEAQEYSSSLTSTGQVGFYGTASYALVANFSLGAANVIPTGMIVAYAGSTPPTGWLNCDGSVYNTASYGQLTSLIGTNYGPALTISETVTPEKVTTYHNAANGSVKITWVAGGSGVFSVTWGATTYYINSTTATYVTISNLSGPVTYNYTFTDYGFNPSVPYARSVAVPYSTVVTPVTTNYVLSAASYRVPRMSSYYFQTYATLNPLIWIIKT